MSLQKTLKYLIYCIALIPLVIFSQYISPFHFGKVIVLRTVVEVMFVLYAILVMKDRSYFPKPDKIFWAFFAFACAFSLATIFSVNPFQSFWGTLERMGGVWTFWHYFVFYVILTSILKTKEDWHTFLKFSVGVGVLSALYGFGQKTNIAFFIGSGGRERIFGTIGNAALFAGYQIIEIFVAIFLALWAKSKTERNWWLVAAALMTLAVFMTAVRGSVIGLTFGLLVSGFLYALRVGSPKLKKRIIGTIIGVIVLGILAVSLRNTSFIKNSRYLNRITNISTSELTVQTRVWAWEAGIEGWKESAKTMLVGWGPEMYNIPFSKHFNPKFFGQSETAFDRAHNMFVEELVTMGIIGLAAYVLFFVVIFQALYQIRKKPENYVAGSLLIGMLVAYLIHNSFIFDTSANYVAFFSVLAFISFLNREPASAPSTRPIVSSSGLRTFIGLVLAVCVVVLIYRTNIESAAANYASTRGIIAAANNDITGAMQSFDKAVPYEGEGRFEYRDQYAQSLLTYTLTNPIDDKTKAAIKDVIPWVEKNAKEYPMDYFPELYLARLNILLGKDDPKSPYNDESLKHSAIALSYAPTFVRTYFEIGQAYLNKKDYPDAIAAMQKAVDLNPDAGQSWWYLAIAVIQSGDVNKGIQTVDQALAHGYVPSEDEDKNLAGVYVSMKDYNRFVSTYERLVKISPNNGQYHATLAAGYVKVGRIDDAVREAHIAAQIDPSFEPDARAFVQSLGRQW